MNGATLPSTGIRPAVRSVCELLFARIALNPCGGLQAPETRREMAQERRLFDNLHAADLVAPSVHLQNGLDYVVDVTLGVDAPRYRKPQQFVRRAFSEHHRSYFHRSDSGV